jgi:hypothetical protein
MATDGLERITVELTDLGANPADQLVTPKSRFCARPV